MTSILAEDSSGLALWLKICDLEALEPSRRKDHAGTADTENNRSM